MSKSLYILCFGKKEHNVRRNFRCNLIAGVINALEAIIMTMLVTRTTGIEDAGILTISFAIGNLFMTVGKFGTRNFQVTDQKEEFSFGEYCKSRFFSTFLMIVMLVGYVIYSIRFLNSDSRKVFIVFLITVIYCVEVVEDVFGGLYQQKGRLDVASVVFSVRWVISIILYAITLFLFKNLLLSVLVATITSILSCIILITFTYQFFKTRHTRVGRWTSIIKKCFPLFAGAFLMMYLTNSPKYAIEGSLTDELQACYGFISTPLFAMELMNNFLYQPQLDEMSKCWQGGNLKKFSKYIVKQICLLFILSAVILFGTYYFGIPVLSVVFNYDLSAYRIDLLILMFGSCLLAYVGFFAVILTIMRKQNQMMICYIVASTFAFFSMHRVVTMWQIRGGVIAFDIVIFILSLLLGSVVLIQYAKKRRERK